MRGWLAIGLLVTACASSVVVETTTTPTTVPPPSTTSAPSTTSPPATTLPATDAQDLAPDFTLMLGDGGEFTLSEATKPVYLVFWAEWCPVCRKELPVVDRIAADYADRVDFVAPIWKSGEDAAREAAGSLFQSGKVQWGMDLKQVIFSLYGVPYQPVTVLIGHDGVVVDSWAGVRAETRVREALDELLSAGTAP